jgi:DNA-binding beta-propeller fold protein YncE
MAIAIAALALAVPAHAAPFAYVADDEGVSQYRILADGRLAPLSPPEVSADAETGALAVAVNPKRRSIYASSFGNPTEAMPRGRVFQYAIGGDGRLSHYHPRSLRSGYFPRDIVASPDGENAYTADVGNDLDFIPGTLSQYDVAASGRLAPESPLLVRSCSALGLTMSPDSKSVYVACGEGQDVAHYGVRADGTLFFKSSIDSETAPFDVAVSPDGESLYVAGGFEAISQYDIGDGGLLTPKDPPFVAVQAFLTNIVVGPYGRNVYASSFGDDRVFQFDVAADGTLTPKDPASVATGNGPRGLAVNPDGRSLYVVNSGEASVSQYDIVRHGGRLSPKTPPTVPSGDGPFNTAVTPVPTTRSDCADGGWRAFPGFGSRCQCLRFVNRAGLGT